MKTVGTVFALVALSASVCGAQELDGLAAEALAAEKAIWQAEIDGDVAGFGEKLAPDFVQVTTGADVHPSITAGRQAAVAAIEEALQTTAFGAFEIDSPRARVEGNALIFAYRFLDRRRA